MTTEKEEPSTENSKPKTGIKAPKKKFEESPTPVGSGMVNLLNKGFNEAMKDSKKSIAETSVGKAAGAGLSGVAKTLVDAKDDAKGMALGALTKGADSVKQRVCAAKAPSKSKSEEELSDNHNPMHGPGR